MLGNLPYCLVCQTAGKKSVRSYDRSCRHRFSSFSSVFKQILKMDPKFQVPTVCFSCGRQNLNLSKLSSIAVKPTKIIFQNYTSTLIHKIKILWPLSQATASNQRNVIISFCSCQKDERARPGSRLTKWCSFSLPTMMCLSFIPRLSTFTNWSTILYTCFSLCAWDTQVLLFDESYLLFSGV
jgi:hypothetical protein